ncbi:hypothetical protein [Nocardioides zeicaulis]|uniref:Uncharacterized protein n=1 Tax=Nocardioides zeicaulis TaxID=1776857 RepID=A0ABV6E244_9ACTN
MSPHVAARAARAGGALVDQLRSTLGPSSSSPAGASSPTSGWLAVTVLCQPDELDPASLPAPLAELGDRIEVDVRPAPADKGTELYARLIDRSGRSGAASRLSGSDAEAELRSALRRAKQLIEVGEVLAVDPAPHGKRTATPGGALLESWTKDAPAAGVR